MAKTATKVKKPITVTAKKDTDGKVVGFTGKNFNKN